MNEQYISHLESLSNLLYTSQNEQEITNAGQTLCNVLESSENFKNLIPILKISQNPNLIFLTIRAITKVLPSEWKMLSKEEKNILYQEIFNMLFDQQPRQAFIITGLSKALARISRLGWLESDSIKNVINSIQQIIEQNLLFAERGFKFFEEILNEMVEPIKNRPLSVNRRTAISFRDEAMEKVFAMCMYFLSKIQEIPNSLIVEVLNVLIQSLTFDFLAICSDETNEDSLCLQIPLTWKHHFENSVSLDYLEFLIINGNSEVETLAMRAFNHMGAIRKSIFANDQESKMNYEQKYLKILGDIITNKNISGDTKFEYMTTCKRFFSNFNLKECYEKQAFSSWLNALANFSAGLFSNRESLYSGYESSFHIWSYLAYEAHHQLPQGNQIEIFLPKLFDLFLQSTLNNAAPDLLDEEVENEFKDQLTQIGLFCQYYYPQFVVLIETNYSTAVNSYESARAQGLNLKVYEAKLAWLTFIASSLISLREKKVNQSEEHLDGPMINFVLQLAAQTSLYNPLECLEAAIIHFMTALTKSYINSPHETIWIFYEKSRGVDDGSAEIITEETLKFVIKSLLNKLIHNLTRYSEGRIIRWTLELFEWLTKGFYSSKILVKIDIIQNLMIQYQTYQLCSTNPKYRERLYSALTNLWVNEEVQEPLTHFLTPIGSQIQRLLITPNEVELQFLYKELKGVCNVLFNSKLYNEFFEWFYEGNISIIFTTVQNYMYDSNLINSLLGFLTELAFSRNTRITFDVACAYGIIIFKNLSHVLTACCKSLIEQQINQANYNLFYKRIKNILKLIVKLLGGNYVNFGVFEVYGDTCFLETISFCFSVLDKIPKSEVITYSKLVDNIYEFLELITKSHLKTVFTRLQSSCYSTIVFYILQGLNSNNMKNCLSAANATTFICDYIIRIGAKNTEETEAVKRILNEFPSSLSDLLSQVMDIILTEDSNYIWTLSKPLLGLLIINENSFEQIKNFSITKATNNPQSQQILNEALSKLMNGIARNMDARNRDRFAKNFNDLRSALNLVN